MLALDIGRRIAREEMIVLTGGEAPSKQELLNVGTIPNTTPVKKAAIWGAGRCTHSTARAMGILPNKSPVGLRAEPLPLNSDRILRCLYVDTTLSSAARDLLNAFVSDAFSSAAVRRDATDFRVPGHAVPFDQLRFDGSLFVKRPFHAL